MPRVQLEAARLQQHRRRQFTRTCHACLLCLSSRSCVHIYIHIYVKHSSDRLSFFTTSDTLHQTGWQSGSNIRIYTDVAPIYIHTYLPLSLLVAWGWHAAPPYVPPSLARISRSITRVFRVRACRYSLIAIKYLYLRLAYMRTYVRMFAYLYICNAILFELHKYIRSDSQRNIHSQ